MNKEFKKVDLLHFNTNVFDDFQNKWALVTAGSLEHHNTLTVGWGSLGVLWRKKVCTIYVRESRYTYQFLEDNDYFTVSFYDEENKDALKIYGTLSGRDCNKDLKTNLSPFTIDEIPDNILSDNVKLSDNVISYKEANTIIVCKKIYSDVFKKELFLDDDVIDFYNKTKEDKTVHHFYIGEIIGIYQK